MKPILFNTPMVQAILDGRKATTRRILKIPDGFESMCGDNPSGMLSSKYKKGDVLYVRETFAVGKIDGGEDSDGSDAPYISQCKGENDIIPKEYAIRYGIGMDEVVWKPSIFMPKEAARIFLKVTNVRAERLQEITTDGIVKEGTKVIKSGYKRNDAIFCFSALWNSTIKESDVDRYGWDANPWVWVIEFERCENPCNT